MRLRALLVGMLLLAALWTATGCTEIKEAVEPPPTIVTQEATVAAPGAAVEGDLPADTDWLPVWPGSEVVSADSEDGVVAVSLTTAEKFEDVLAGTTVGFERAGWTVAEGAGEASATVLDVSNADYEGIVTMTPADEAVSIDYFLTARAE